VIRVFPAVLLVALAALTGPRVARGDEDPQIAEARRFFDAGKQAYEAGEYGVAATAFEEAYRLAPRPPVAFSMAQAYRRQFFVDRDATKLKRALDLYKLYIVQVPQGGRRDDAVQHIAELEPLLVRIEDDQRRQGLGPVEATGPAARGTTQLMISSRTRGASARLDGAPAAAVPVIRDVAPGKHGIRVEAPGYFPEAVEAVAVEGRLVVVEVPLRARPARLVVRAPEGARVSIDGREVGVLPLVQPLEVAAGRRWLTVERRGHYPVTRELRLSRGEELVADAPLERTRQRHVSYWMLGAAGAALLVGGTTATLAFVHEERAEDILDRRASGPITQADLDAYNRERGRRDDHVTASYVLLGGAVALGIGGGLLYWLDAPPPTWPALSDAPRHDDFAPPTAASGITFLPSVGAHGAVGAVLTGAF
jgi:hypothetical protein